MFDKRQRWIFDVCDTCLLIESLLHIQQKSCQRSRQDFQLAFAATSPQDLSRLLSIFFGLLAFSIQMHELLIFKQNLPLGGGVGSGSRAGRVVVVVIVVVVLWLWLWLQKGNY